MIVSDTNLLVYLLLPGDRTAKVQQFYLREPDWVAPFLWRSELINVLVTYHRLGKIEFDLCLQLMNQAERIMERRSYTIESETILEVAARTGCSGYDAEFVALAEQLNLPLVTYDEAILQRCQSVARKPW
jgi:predicted nucleic acid-binding protein